MLQLTFSNQIDLLFDELKKHLFIQRDPFDQIWVIVPSPIMKSWLMRKLAEDEELKIAFGFQVLYLDEAIRQLGIKKGKSVPDKVELALALHEPDDPQMVYASLERADQILRYGQHGLPPEDKLPSSDWVLESEWLNSLEIGKCPKAVHLFAINFLTDSKLQFFNRLSQKCKTFFWVISPSRMYAADLYSEKEKMRWLQKLYKQQISPIQIDALESYLESNDLLASNNKLQREWMKLLEGVHADVEERYAITSAWAEHEIYQDLLLDGVEKTDGAAILLKAIQADLLLIRPTGTKIPISKQDRSIEIHAAPSMQREVEAIYEIILHRLNNTTLHPKDILVLVPDLEKYIPFIKRIFAAGPVKAEISESTKLDGKPYLQTFVELLDLPLKRWSLDEVLDLLQKPQFRMKESIPIDELMSIRELFKAAGIRWGLSREHREEFLNSKLAEQDNRFTWEGGISELMHSLGTRFSKVDVMEKNSLPHACNLSPSFSLSPSVGVFLAEVQNLKKTFQSYAIDKPKTLLEWSQILSVLQENYLDTKSEEDEESQAILGYLIRYLTQSFTHRSSPLSYASLLIFFKELLKERLQAYHEKDLNAIRVLPLLPARAVSAKVIVLMGLNSESFPRKIKKSPYERLKPSVYMPTAADQDRSLFLESLLSAQESWICSYFESAQNTASSVLEELIEYVESNYDLASRSIVVKHPAFAFDTAYFKEIPIAAQYSNRAYSVANALNSKKIEENPQIFHPSQIIEIPAHITLQQLKNIFSHPLRAYLKQKLQIQFPYNKPIHEAFKDLEEEYWSESDWLKWALRYPIDRVLAFADRLGKFPVEPFKSAAKNKLRQKIENTLRVLNELSIKKEELFEIEFSHEALKYEQQTDYRWRAPALKVPYKSKSITITGVLPYVAPKGLISMKDLSLESYASMLPEIMAHAMLPEEISAKKLFSLNKGKDRQYQMSDKWEQILDHYFTAVSVPSLLHPGWIQTVLDSDVAKLKDLLEKSVEKDSYFAWINPHLLKSDLQCLMDQWKKPAEELFKEGIDVTL